MNEHPISNSPGIDSPNSPSTTPSVSSAASDLRSAAGDFAKTTEAQAANLKDKAVETAQALKVNAAERAQQLKAAATEKAEHYKTVATDKAHHARETAQQQWVDTRVKAKEIHVTAEDYIRQNPTKAVLSALGVGFLIGLITRR
ncbi:YqjD family protein [Luteolibacter algae]|uniref:YqjD family protein n=1 Tax=Luteolibacter algae TaxID=454151 RepID=A0ABW5D410_9BACT